jgi:hypothetical protein
MPVLLGERTLVNPEILFVSAQEAALNVLHRASDGSGEVYINIFRDWANSSKYFAGCIRGTDH